MAFPSTQAILGAGAAVLAVAVSLAAGASPLVVAASLACAAAGLAAVASAAQARRLRDEQRLVYRPVYVRKQVVQRRVTSDD